MQDIKKKKMICKALAKVAKKLRSNKSQFMLASENDLSTSIISTIERGIKDPQLTTMFKLAEIYNVDVSEFVKMVRLELPEDFSLIDK